MKYVFPFFRSKEATSLMYATAVKDIWKNVTQFNWQSFKNAGLRRAFRKLSFEGKLALDGEHLQRVRTPIRTEMCLLNYVTLNCGTPIYF